MPENKVQDKCDEVMVKALSMIDGLLNDANTTRLHHNRDAAATEKPSDGNENFDGWLSLTVNTKRAYEFNLGELKIIRDESRIACITSEVAKNVIKHYKNHIIGEEIMLACVDALELEDPVKLSKSDMGGEAKTLIENWRLFTLKNNFIERAKSALEKAMRDGECPIRLFKQGTEAPVMRFIDPDFIKSDKDKMDLGVVHNPDDIEEILEYGYVDPDLNEQEHISAEEIVFIKRNVDYDSLRGLPDFYPVNANIRRIEKLLINTSVMTQIHTAVAMVRTIENTNQAGVDALIAKNSDNKGRVDAELNRGVNSRKFRPGTIVTGGKGTKYEFPASNVDPSKYTAIIDKELAHVAINFVLPQDWLLGNEPENPLSPGSPVIANFREQQGWFYNYIIELFWKVQEMMGVDIETSKPKFEVYIVGPRLAVGKVLDEARAQQIFMQLGATSPQEIAQLINNRYVISRSNVLKHRETLQPDEVAPGDLGNTNPAQNDGTSKKGGGTKTDGAPGGNTKDGKELEKVKVLSIIRDDKGRIQSIVTENDKEVKEANE